MKVVLISLGILVLLGILAAAGFVYAAHLMERKLEQSSSQRGIDLNAKAAQGAMGKQAGLQVRDGCLLLLAEEVHQFTGITIVRADGTPTTGDMIEHCEYYGDLSEMRQQTREELDRKRQAIQGGNAAVHPEDDQRFAEALANSIAASEGRGSPVIRFHVLRGLSRGQSLLTRAYLALDTKLRKVDGVGDQAAIGATNQVMFVRKGESFVIIGLGPIPEARGKAAELARRIVSRL